VNILVGYAGIPAAPRRWALACSCSAGGGGLTVAPIVPETWGHPSMARVDAEYAQFLDQPAQRHWTRRAPTPTASGKTICPGRGCFAKGLLAVAEEAAADCIVLGSARSAPRAESAWAASLPASSIRHRFRSH